MLTLKKPQTGHTNDSVESSEVTNFQISLGTANLVFKSRLLYSFKADHGKLIRVDSLLIKLHCDCILALN